MYSIITNNINIVCETYAIYTLILFCYLDQITYLIQIYKFSYICSKHEHLVDINRNQFH